MSCTVALFPTFRGLPGDEMSGTKGWDSAVGSMEKLFKALYGELEFEELQSSSFPALSIFLFALYNFLLLLAIFHGASHIPSPSMLAHEANRYSAFCE
jgi:hypothetical protein